MSFEAITTISDAENRARQIKADAQAAAASGSGRVPFARNQPFLHTIRNVQESALRQEFLQIPKKNGRNYMNLLCAGEGTQN